MENETKNMKKTSQSKETIVIEKSDWEGIINLTEEVKGMLVEDYYYSFDLKLAGDYIISLRQQLENQAEGTSLKVLRKRDKEERRKSWNELKEFWKVFCCSTCGFLPPNLWTNKRNGDPETLSNYPGDKDLIASSWKDDK